MGGMSASATTAKAATSASVRARDMAGKRETDGKRLEVHLVFALRAATARVFRHNGQSDACLRVCLIVCGDKPGGARRGADKGLANW